MIGFLAEITETLCREYVDWRCAQTDKRATKSKGRTIKPTTARRELVTLSAALQLVLPQQASWSPDRLSCCPRWTKRRERYLTRSQVAALLWAALGFNRDGTRNRFRINRHLARFILISLYTGTRHDAILRLQWMASGRQAAGSILRAACFIVVRRMRSKPTSGAIPPRASCRTSTLAAGSRPST